VHERVVLSPLLPAAYGRLVDHSKLHLPAAPPPLNEGESLVSRILQLGPPGTKYLGYGGKKCFFQMKQSMDASLSVLSYTPSHLMTCCPYVVVLLLCLHCTSSATYGPLHITLLRHSIFFHA